MKRIVSLFYRSRMQVCLSLMILLCVSLLGSICVAAGPLSSLQAEKKRLESTLKTIKGKSAYRTVEIKAKAKLRQINTMIEQRQKGSGEVHPAYTPLEDVPRREDVPRPDVGGYDWRPAAAEQSQEDRRRAEDYRRQTEADERRRREQEEDERYRREKEETDRRARERAERSRRDFDERKRQEEEAAKREQPAVPEATLEKEQPDADGIEQKISSVQSGLIRSEGGDNFVKLVQQASDLILGSAKFIDLEDAWNILVLAEKAKDYGRPEQEAAKDFYSTVIRGRIDDFRGGSLTVDQKRKVINWEKEFESMLLKEEPSAQPDTTSKQPDSAPAEQEPARTRKPKREWEDDVDNDRQAKRPRKQELVDEEPEEDEPDARLFDEEADKAVDEEPDEVQEVDVRRYQRLAYALYTQGNPEKYSGACSSLADIMKDEPNAFNKKMLMELMFYARTYDEREDKPFRVEKEELSSAEELFLTALRSKSEFRGGESFSPDDKKQIRGWYNDAKSK